MTREGIVPSGRFRQGLNDSFDKCKGIFTIVKSSKMRTISLDITRQLGDNGDMDKIQIAYEAGRGAAELYASMEAAVYADAYDGTMDRAESIAWDMGFRGQELRIVTGWRYGDIPECGCSGDYRDQRYERGVSLMAIDGEDCGTEDTAIEGMAISDRPIIRVRGYYSGRGATGEPLVIGATKID